MSNKLDTIEDPHNKHTIEDHGHSWIFWLAEVHPLEKLLWTNLLILIPGRMVKVKEKTLATEKGKRND